MYTSVAQSGTPLSNGRTSGDSPQMGTLGKTLDGITGVLGSMNMESGAALPYSKPSAYTMGI